MELCILIAFIGLLLIIDSIFDILRRLGLRIPRKYTRYFAPIGFFMIIVGLLLNQGGIC